MDRWQRWKVVFYIYWIVIEGSPNTLKILKAKIVMKRVIAFESQRNGEPYEQQKETDESRKFFEW